MTEQHSTAIPVEIREADGAQWLSGVVVAEGRAGSTRQELWTPRLGSVVRRRHRGAGDPPTGRSRASGSDPASWRRDPNQGPGNTRDQIRRLNLASGFFLRNFTH